MFGEEIAELVEGVTKLSRLELDRRVQAPGREPAQVHPGDLASDVRVLLVKLADRLHNMRTLHFIKNAAKRERIARETLEIYAPLARSIGCHRICIELEELAFSHLNPVARDAIVRRLDTLRAEPGRGGGHGQPRDLRQAGGGRRAGPGVRPREAPLFDLAQAAAQVDRLLAAVRHLRLPGDRRHRGRLLPRAGRHPPHLAVRAGAVQGLHLDAQAQQLPLDPHHRGRARRACASRCRSAPRPWTWWPRRASPPTGATRTRAYGFDPEAAEAAGGRDPLANLRQLVQVLEHGGDAEELVEHAKLEMFLDQVFVFTPKGRLISLPRGAMPLDFAYAVHTDVGDTCVGVKINGELRPLRTELTNGDVVEVIRGAEAARRRPTGARWPITGRARSAIRRHIRQTEKEEFVRLGRASLEQTLRARRQGAGRTSPGARRWSASRVATEAELFDAVGRGRVTPGPGAGGGVPRPEGDRARRRHRPAQDRGRARAPGSTCAAAA